VEVLAGDLQDLELGKRAVNICVDRWGRVDAVVVNHGTLEPVKKVADTEASEWAEAFGVNVFSAVALVSVSLVFSFPSDYPMQTRPLLSPSPKAHRQPFCFTIKSTIFHVALYFSSSVLLFPLLLHHSLPFAASLHVTSAHYSHLLRSSKTSYLTHSQVKAAIPSLRQTHGTIIFTSSGAAVKGYTGWSCYGASKAVLNHFAISLAVEEPLITSIAIRPGVVDTEMQRDIREKHAEAMGPKDSERFMKLKEEGGLLRPEQPGHVIAKLAVAGKEGIEGLSGKFLNWDDGSLGAFQEEGEGS
jgi:NAD(P)-dependent dehydrogenase (short-subunit alcohol dehydrogenase family)